MSRLISGFISNPSDVHNYFIKYLFNFFPSNYGDGKTLNRYGQKITVCEEYQCTYPYTPSKKRNSSVYKHHVLIRMQKDSKTSLNPLSFGIIEVEGEYSNNVADKLLRKINAIEVGLNNFKIPNYLMEGVNQQK